MRKFSPRELNWLRRWEVSPCGAGSCFAGQTSKPVEYITGRAEFCGREFLVTPDVLIPRIETEELVVHSIKLVTSLDKSEIMVADIGTGCGCVGITLYLELIKLGIRPTVYMSDTSEEVLEVAKKNISSLRATPMLHRGSAAILSSIKLLKSDLLSGYPKDLKFDLIVANLPYIPSVRIPKLPESVSNFEPRVAIDGGRDGSLLIKKLIKQARKKLVDDGAMILEIDETHSEKTFANDTGMELKAEIKRDQFGKNRFLVLNKK